MSHSRADSLDRGVHIAVSNAVFFRQLLTVALPVALQVVLFSSRSLVDIVMLGQLGEADVAAIGVAGRAIFVTTLLVLGVCTGGSMLLAQYWGAGDREGMKRTVALTLMITSVVGLAGASVFLFIPERVMGLASNSAEVIALGASFMEITAGNMLLTAIGASFAAGLRSMHQAATSTVFSAIGISLNIFFNYVLIFGRFGFPAMGIVGAAWGTLLSALIEVIALTAWLYWRKHLLAFSWQDMRESLNRSEVVRLLKLAIPLIANMVMWAGGVFLYNAIFGHISTQALAALTVMAPLESLCLAMLNGIATGAAVVIGNQLGASRFDLAYRQAWLAAAFCVACAVVVAVVMLLIKQPVLALFSGLRGPTLDLASSFYIMLSVAVLLKSVPMLMIIGVLRAGGDIKFCFYQDVIAQWFIGIPLVAFLAFYTDVGLQWVYLAIFTEEVVKIIGCFFRVRSRAWIKNMVQTAAVAS
ncbi:MATE family efflux transporter [Plesiomonas shigelloides]|uniref:MATE family efflux transporter n=1 Tax=Plesiomonas shigelloides TaxID=703 RepID=UPI001C5B7BD3|nr:MATE family efflux transporter [Plesiomonas shigelloides]MBW3793607.1 MATE family efflux transporter [Plesiomonas shigelloides]